MLYSLSDDTWDEAEYKAIERVLDSGRFTMGSEVAAFEKAFAVKLGSRYAIMVNSGSSANLLAVAALVSSGRLVAGDEVVVPAVSWSTTYFPLQQYNLKVRFVDINPDTLNIDTGMLEKSITPATKAILAVNLLGNPNEFDKIKDICRDKGLILLEDNCEALGGLYKSRQLGTIGDIGTFSTFYSHHICTMEGGLCTTDDEELYHYMLAIRAHGWTRNLPHNSSIYEKSDNDFYESFNFIMPGYNLRPLEIEAAAGTEQLKKLDGIISRRRENARYFMDRMKSIDGVSIQKETEKSSWFGFAVILKGKNSGKRDALVRMLREKDIEVRPIVAGNFVRNKAISYFDYSTGGPLTNADELHDNGFFAGNHSKNNFKELDMFTDVLGKALR